MGRTAFPEVIEFPAGLIYTRSGRRQLTEHHVTRRVWLPWQVEVEGEHFKATRAVSKDCWFGRGALAEPAEEGLLLLAVRKASGVGLRVEGASRGLIFRWDGGFECQIEFGRGIAEWFVSDNAESVKLHFLGEPDIQFSFDHFAWMIANNTQMMWIGVRFRQHFEYSIKVVAGKSTVTDFPENLEQAILRERDRWETYFSHVVPVVDFADRSACDAWYFAWLTIEANRCDGGTRRLPGPFISPTRLHYGSQWWWDECFHCGLMRWRAEDPMAVYDTLCNFFEAQGEHGEIPGALRFAEAANQTTADLGFPSMDMQPPVIGFVLGLLREVPGWPEGERLKQLYESLRRHALWFAGPARDPDQDGLAEYRHSFDSSGDQSPRWDQHKLDPARVVGAFRGIESVDLNVWLSLLWEHLAEMAERLARVAEARDCRNRGRAIFARIEDWHWEEADGFYYDIDATTHEKIRVKTPYGFMPLLHPQASPERCGRLVNEHLLNPQEFWCEFPLPSVALDDPAFSEILMWRGPSWINVNWLVAHGLAQAGYRNLATELTRRTLLLVGSQYDARGLRTRTPRIWEWFNPLTGKELGNHHYSWSALVVDLIIEFFSGKNAEKR